MILFNKPRKMFQEINECLDNDIRSRRKIYLVSAFFFKVHVAVSNSAQVIVSVDAFIFIPLISKVHFCKRRFCLLLY